MLEPFASSPFARSILEDRYARERPDGTRETWPEVAGRVVEAVMSVVPHDALCFCVDCLGSQCGCGGTCAVDGLSE